MEDIADALRGESQIRRLSPNQEVERHIEKLSPEIRFSGGAAVVRDPDVGLLPKVGAPGGIILEKLFPEAAEDGGVE